jgi:hypothetical protein
MGDVDFFSFFLRAARDFLKISGGTFRGCRKKFPRGASRR